MADVASGVTETTETPDGPVVVALIGEHDLRTKDRLLEELGEVVSEHRLVVDLDRATFIDSSVLHVLVEIDRAAGEAGTVVVLRVGLEHPAGKVLDTSGLLGHLKWAPTTEQALEFAR